MKKQGIKRWIAAGLSVMLLSGCGGNLAAPKDNKAADGEKVSLYDRGLQLIAKMDMMAESEDYIEIVTSSTEIVEVIREIGDGDYTEPKKVYEIKMSEDIMKNLLDVYGAQNYSLPEELQEELKRRIIVSIPTMLSAMEGSNILAAVSLITADDYFIDNSITEDTMYFYVYEGRCCGAVVFSVHDDGIISASGRIVVSEIPSKAADVEDVKEWLVQNAGLLGVEISEVSP